MARITINDADSIADKFPLSSGLGVDLRQNIDWSATRRLKRHAITYYCDASSSVAAAPPNGDSTIVGPTIEIGGVNTADAESIGLRLSSPPTTALALYLGSWPLSAQATSIRLVVSCRVQVAAVDLFACMVLGTQAIPFRPSEELQPDDEGVVAWSPQVQASGAYVSVGITEPSATELAKPVVLTIPLDDALGVDLGKHGQEDHSQTCRLYLCFLSKVGALDANVVVPADGAIIERRRIRSTRRFDLDGNPGPFHRWLYSAVADDTGSTSGTWFPRWRGIIQRRPTNITDPGVAATKTDYVVHPPFDWDSRYGVETETVAAPRLPEQQGYTCGVLGLRSISIQELA